MWSSGDGSGRCLGLSKNSRQAHMRWAVFSSVKQYVLYLMSLGTIWPGELPARIACTIAWHCLILLYLSPHVSPRTTTSGRWQNTHSNKTHCIVFTAFETWTGNFTRHCVEGRVLQHRMAKVCSPSPYGPEHPRKSTRPPGDPLDS